MKRYLLFATSAAAATLLAAGAMAAPYGHGNNAASAQNSQHTMQKPMMNWYGGPIYHGKPALKATAALVRAGGGPENFSFSKALVSMLGPKTVHAEVAKLQKQYGKKRVEMFIHGMTYDVRAGLKFATAAGVKLPSAPADLKGKKLAKALVKAGTAKDGTFWAGYLFDHAVSHKIHNQIMIAVNNNEGQGGGYGDMNTHFILNQAMYDVAQALGMKHVKRAPTRFVANR